MRLQHRQNACREKNIAHTHLCASDGSGGATKGESWRGAKRPPPLPPPPTALTNLLDDGLEVDVGHNVPRNQHKGVGSHDATLVDVAQGVSGTQAVVGGDDSHLFTNKTNVCKQEHQTTTKYVAHMRNSSMLGYPKQQYTGARDSHEKMQV